MSISPPTDDIKRRHTMSRIKNRNTSIEVSLRKALWRAGIKYRINYTKLPGAPDIVITKNHIAIFCDGEFWHGKDWEAKKHRIQSNREYWIAKIERNINRDREIEMTLSTMGWTVIRFWGSDIKNNLYGCVEDVKDAIFQSTIEAYNKNHEYVEANNIREGL